MPETFESVLFVYVETVLFGMVLLNGKTGKLEVLRGIDEWVGTDLDMVVEVKILLNDVWGMD